MKPNNSDIEFRNGPGSNQDLGDNTVWCLCCGHRADPLEAACSRRLATGRISRLWATFTGFHSFFHPNLIVHTMVHMMKLTTVPFLMSLFVASNGFGVLPRIYSKFPLTIVSFLALFLKIELFVRAVSSSQPSSSNVNIESRPSLPKVSFSGKTATGPSGPTIPGPFISGSLPLFGPKQHSAESCEAKESFRRQDHLSTEHRRAERSRRHLQHRN